MQIHLICKVCYTEMEAQFTADEINDEINLFVVPCKQCAAQQGVQADEAKAEREVNMPCPHCGKLVEVVAQFSLRQ